MVRVILDSTYTSSQYHHGITNNNSRSISDNNNHPINNNLYDYNRYVCTDGISPHYMTQYNNYLLSVVDNILNTNQNSLSTLSVNYIGYFYDLYAKLITIFPNLFSHSSLSHIDSLIKYINCSLIEFNSYISYFISSISPSLTSNLSNKESLTSVVEELPPLIKKVVCNLKSAIAHNISLVCLHITKIDSSIKCFNKQIHEAMHIINCINNLLGSKCKDGITSFQNCLNQIKCKFIELQTELCNLYHSYCHIDCLMIETQNIIRCNNDILNLNTKICKLVKEIKCSIREFKCIDSKIKCAKSKIEEIKNLKQELFKYIETSGNTMKLTIKCDRTLIAYIVKVNDSNGNEQQIKCLIEKLKCLAQNIDKTCSQFQKIDKNTRDLKHSLMFNSYYFQISSYILTELSCIDSQQILLRCKLSDLKDVQSQISVITYNIRDINLMIKEMYERRDDLAYLRESLCSIMPKLCRIKEAATKIKQLQSVVNGLYRIKSSIENLKKVESDDKCLEICESSHKTTSIQTFICITHKLEINCITEKISTIEKSTSTFDILVCNTIKLLEYIEKIENSMRWIVAWINKMNRRLDNIIKRFILCSLQSLTNNTTVAFINHNWDIELDNQVLSVYSVSNVMDYGMVVNRLFECSKKIDQILQLVPWYDSCQCILRFEYKNKNKIDLGIINVQKIIEYITKENNKSDDLNLDKIKDLVQNDIRDNHFCLCMVFKYILYPQIITLTYLMSIDLETLSTLSRKYDRYGLSKGFMVDLSQFFIVCVELLYKVAMYILLKYKYTWFSGHPFYIKCFCLYSDDPYYPYLISIVLFLSSLIENIWNMDTESVRMSIECLSSLLSEYQSLHVYTNYYSPSSYNGLRNIISILTSGKSTEVSGSHSIFAMGVGMKDKGSLVSSGMTNITTITESKKQGETTTTTVISTTKKGAIGILNESTKLAFMSVRTMILGTHFSKDKLTLIYGKFSSLSFYTQNSKVINTTIMQTIGNPGIEISLKYLDKICEKQCEETCQKNGVCKICAIAKIRINCLSISFKDMRLIIGNVSGDILLNYLIGSRNISQDFITNLCVGFGEVYTIMLKNTQLTSSTHPILNHKNSIESRNWGYDTRYEHQVSKNNNVTDNCLNLLDALNNNENTLTKLHYFSSLLSSSVDRNFSLVSSSCFEISS